MDVKNLKKYVNILDDAIVIKNIELIEVVEPDDAKIIQKDQRVYFYIIKTKKQGPVTVKVRRLAEIFCLRIDPQDKSVLWVILPPKPSIFTRLFSRIFRRIVNR
jgi:hypothetical protein